VARDVSNSRSSIDDDAMRGKSEAPRLCSGGEGAEKATLTSIQFCFYYAICKQQPRMKVFHIPPASSFHRLHHIAVSAMHTAMFYAQSACRRNTDPARAGQCGKSRTPQRHHHRIAEFTTARHRVKVQWSYTTDTHCFRNPFRSRTAFAYQIPQQP